MTDQHGNRRKGKGTGSSGRSVIDMADAKTQVDTDLRVHGIQSDFDTDEQSGQQRDGQASAGELPQQENQNHLKDEQQPLASVDRDLLRAINQRCQLLGDQKPQNVAGCEDLAEPGVAVPAGLQIDGGKAYNAAEAAPVKPLNQGVFQICDTEQTGRLMHRNHRFIIKMR